MTLLTSVNRLLIWLFLTLLLTACSSPNLSQLDSDATILTFGDSLTAGYGVSEKESYPAVLAELSGLKVVNAGVSGETTAQGLQRLPEVLEQYQPHLVILFEGGNDILQKKSNAVIKNNLRQMIQIIQQSGAEVLLVGVPQKKLFAGSLPLYEELADEFHIPLEEDIVGSLMIRPSMKSDFVHFNSNGYRELAEAIFEKLQKTGALQ